MIYYIPLFLLLFGICKFDIKKTGKITKQYKFLEFLTCSLLILIPGLSYRIGIDTPSYMAEYLEIKPLYDICLNDLFNSDNELLWTLFCMVCKTFSSDFAFMQYKY